MRGKKNNKPGYLNKKNKLNKSYSVGVVRRKQGRDGNINE
jgi:hypothetical protein